MSTLNSRRPLNHVVGGISVCNPLNSPDDPRKAPNEIISLDHLNEYLCVLARTHRTRTPVWYTDSNRAHKRHPARHCAGCSDSIHKSHRIIITIVCYITPLYNRLYSTETVYVYNVIVIGIVMVAVTVWPDLFTLFDPAGPLFWPHYFSVEPGRRYRTRLFTAALWQMFELNPGIWFWGTWGSEGGLVLQLIGRILKRTPALIFGAKRFRLYLI